MGRNPRERERENLDLGLDVVDGVAALDLESDGLSGQSLHEDLHLLPFSSSSSDDDRESEVEKEIRVRRK